jgi:hypothetical protein
MYFLGFIFFLLNGIIVSLVRTNISKKTINKERPYKSVIMPIQWYIVSVQVKVKISLHFAIIPLNFIIYSE